MTEFITHWEQEAINLMNSGDKEKAILLFKKIINTRPDFEHGICFYHLACCLEDLNQLEQAKENYIKALDFNNEDPIRLGGYASFLYLHGSSTDAFQTHIKLIKLEKKLGLDTSSTLSLLKLLGEKIGLSIKQVIDEVNSL